MPGIKELKTRIKSIGSTRKITRAMQMVSAAKMRRAQQAALNSRTYSELAWELIGNLTGTRSSVIPTEVSASERSGGIPQSSDTQSLRDSSARMHLPTGKAGSLGMTDTENPLLKTYPDAKKTGVIIISTNTGLVGGFNSNLMAAFRQLENNLYVPQMHSGHLPSKGRSSASLQGQTAEPPSPSEERGRGEVAVVAELFVMGRKAKDYAVRFGKKLAADFPKADRLSSIESIYPLARMVSDLYKTGEYKNISIIYNKFISTLSQKATVKQLLPFTPTTPSANAATPPLEGGDAPAAAEAMAGRPQLSQQHRGASHPVKGEYLAQRGEGVGADYLFEPNPTFVLNNLLPRIIESQIYQAVLESDAGEHSARMVTMKNATEAAGDLISDLTLTYNQLRQNKITTELAEITAGKIALE